MIYKDIVSYILMQKIETINYYNGIADGYRELYHDEQKKKIDLVEKYIQTEGRVIDLGSGDGVLNDYLNSCDDFIFVSCDICLNLLLKNNNLLKVNCDIHKLPFKNESFNFLFSFSVLQDLTDVRVALLEMKRILVCGGRGIVSFVKFSKKREEIISILENYFNIEEIIQEEKDLIFIFNN